MYLKEAEALGVPAAAMASTPPVENTAEEAAAIRRLLMARSAAQPWDRDALSGRITLVISAFHVRCAQRLFES